MDARHQIRGRLPGMTAFAISRRDKLLAVLTSAADERVQVIGAEDDQLHGLLVFVALGVDIGDAFRVLTGIVEIDVCDFALRFQGEVRFPHQLG